MNMKQASWMETSWNLGKLHWRTIAGHCWQEASMICPSYFVSASCGSHWERTLLWMQKLSECFFFQLTNGIFLGYSSFAALQCSTGSFSLRPDPMCSECKLNIVLNVHFSVLDWFLLDSHDMLMSFQNQFNLHRPWWYFHIKGWQRCVLYCCPESSYPWRTKHTTVGIVITWLSRSSSSTDLYQHSVYNGLKVCIDGVAASLTWNKSLCLVFLSSIFIAVTWH